MSIVKIEGLTKKFGSTVAVDNSSLEIEKGKIYGLLGPNGSGKSTMMKLIAGLFKMTKGSILINEVPLSYKSKANIAYMSTESFMYPNMSIAMVGQYFKDFYADFDEIKYEKLIKDMNLDMKMNVSSLSSGMNAKLQVAATLSRKSDVIMLDEPLNGIDLIARDQIIKAIIDSATEENTIIISSHLVDQMEPILDEILFIKEGQLIIQGDAEELRISKSKSIVELYKEVFSC